MAPQQLTHRRHEFAPAARYSFAIVKSVLKDNPVVKCRNGGRVDGFTCSSAFPPTWSRGTSKSTGAFLPRREVLCLPARFSASCKTGSSSRRDLETHKLRTAQNVAHIGTPMGETGVRYTDIHQHTFLPTYLMPNVAPAKSRIVEMKIVESCI